MHARGIAHLDVEPGSVLLTADPAAPADALAAMRLQLCDFGSARRIQSAPQVSFCGNVQFVAPGTAVRHTSDSGGGLTWRADTEMLLGKAFFGPECDVWSAGVTLYVMLTGNLWVDMYAAVVEDFYQEPTASAGALQPMFFHL
jgi:serine/threonine protein kinase